MTTRLGGAPESSPESNADTSNDRSNPPATAGETPPPREAGLFVDVSNQLGTIVLAVLIALSIRSFVVEPFRIPSASMFPTLLVGDHLFVNKFVYGVRLPFTDLRLPPLREPERGEVVVFSVAKSGNETFPADERPDLQREQFVKRIVGLPGERVEVRGGEVFIDGRRLDSRPSGETFDDDRGGQLEIHRVTLPDRAFRTLDDPFTDGPPDAAIDVPQGRYFVLGDNRDHSKDSRSWGTVRLEEIRGPAIVLYWSWAWDGAWIELANPLTWWDLMTRRMRWNRVGAAID